MMQATPKIGDRVRVRCCDNMPGVLTETARNNGALYAYVEMHDGAVVLAPLADIELDRVDDAQRGGGVMRCTDDAGTAELPGLEPYTPPEPRMTASDRRETMQYVGPKQRVRCASCRHALDKARGQQVAVWCTLGRFIVERGAWCIEHDGAGA